MDTTAELLTENKQLKSRLLLSEVQRQNAESKTKAAESKTEAAESKTEAAESKTEAAESKIEAAESKTEAAESKTKAAESKIEAAESKTKAAESKTEEIETKYRKKSEDYDRIIQAFMQLQREKFGSKSERFVDDAGQQMLFGSELPDTEVEEDDYEEITYTRKRSGKKAWDLSKLPSREVIIPVSDEDRKCSCGCEKEVIRYNETSRLDFIPAKMEIVIEKREVVACRKGCDDSPKAASAPKRAIQKCKATESLLAYVAVSKVLDRHPLYHLERKLKREHQWHIPRQTMSRWMVQLSCVLQPLINLMQDELLGYDIASIDATSFQVLREPGIPAEKKSNAYCIRGGSPGKEVTLFEYNAYSHQDYIVTLFETFKGCIHVDAHQDYDKVDKRDDIILCFCNAHARRNFEKIYKATKKKDGASKKAMSYYKALYAVEADARDMTPDQRYDLRLERSKPILDDFKSWLEQREKETLPKSPIGKAVLYCLNYWDSLTFYLTDGRLEIDNNATERQIKFFVIARKNFLFACTQKGADALGVHFSLILTALNHGLEPFRYYRSVLEKIPYCQTMSDYQALLPWNFDP